MDTTSNRLIARVSHRVWHNLSESTERRITTYDAKCKGIVPELCQLRNSANDFIDHVSQFAGSGDTFRPYVATEDELRNVGKCR